MGEREAETGIRVLLVDDDPAMLRSAARLLGEHFQVTATTESLRALELCNESEFDAVVTDLEMPHLDGAELIARIRKELGDKVFPIIVLTGTSVTRVDGAAVVLHKPSDAEALVTAITAAIRDNVQSVVA